ncbi:hypothetical protein OQH60_08605, partial [Campylobacter sp. MIT 21-1685]|uniref:hypothetical protein n=1 Tax=unclassified Campylobacter TaxID=2593542 RepID=UPI00224B86C2
QDKKAKEKELKVLESKILSLRGKAEASVANATDPHLQIHKQELKNQVAILKKEIAKLKTIAPLNSPCHSSCHTENEARNIPQTPKQIDKSTPSFEKCNFQYKDNALTLSCHSEFALANEESQNKNTFTPPFPIPPTWTWVRLGEVC